MATYSMGDLKKGLKIELDGVPYKIVESSINTSNREKERHSFVVKSNLI